MKKRKVTEAAVKKILTKWRKRLGIDQRWYVKHKLYTDDTWPENHRGDVAFIQVSPGYYQAHLHINGDACARDKDSLTHILLHELNHIIVEPIAIIVRGALGEDQEVYGRHLVEQLVEIITRAMIDVP